MRFNMKSGNFSHASSSTLYKKSQHIVWDFGSNNNSSSFYIDSDFYKGIIEKNDGKRKFLWGLESRFFNHSFHEHIKDNLENILETYEYIFTYDEELLLLDSKFKWVPAMGTWIDSPGVRDKSKNVSMITSAKTFSPDQIFRVDFANSHSDKIDLFGGITKKLENKEEALDDYMFSVAIENDVRDTYFTEKILDCFATGTVPIYRGTLKISEFFNPEGIVFLQDGKFPTLSEEFYYSKKEAIHENLERVLDFNTIEDWMFTNYKEIFTN